MNRSFRLATVHIALAAMMLRALMPAGWMPNSEASAGVPITICTMDGQVHLTLGPDGQPFKKQQNQDDTRHHDLCPFAAAPQMAQPATSASLALPSPISMVAQRIAHRQAAAQNARYASQSPRAPPNTA